LVISLDAIFMIFCVKNIDIEGPEALGDFLKSQGFFLKIVDLSQGDVLPHSLRMIEAVICLGGPMNVDEEQKHPFLIKEIDFIREVVKYEIPFLGICLGAQLLAKACGAKIVRSPQEEIGFSKIFLTEDGLKDPLFYGIEKDIRVFQWHSDMFEIPQGAKWLAQSRKCPYQAFRMGACAYGLQFHMEIYEKNIEQWAKVYCGKEDEAMGLKVHRMQQDYRLSETIFSQTARRIFSNFVHKVIVPMEV